MRVPGKTGKPAASSAPKIDTPEIESWEDQRMLPSLLLIGPSGSGKTNGIAQLCAAGFRLAHIAIEPKALSVGRHKPLRVDICKPIDGKLPTDVQRWARLQALMRGLREGKYRATPDGEPVEILAFDGLTEVADLIYADSVQRFTKKESVDLWSTVGRKTLQFFKDCRDAAGIASTALGLPPVGIVCTCLEVTAKKLDIKTGTSRIERDQPALQGQMALPRLHSIFEVVWHLDAAGGADGEHEFQIHTVLTENHFAKSPAGIFAPVVSGPGGPGNDPDVGKMYREMLTNKDSTYYHEG